MLLELQVEGVDIFYDARVSFGPGLNVIAGETGAGKSVLLACLLATLGEDPPRDLIEEGFLETVWQGKVPDPIAHLLEDDVWALSRPVRQGRVSALAGGRSVSGPLLRDVAVEIVLRSGQHASQELRQASAHLEMLDRFAGIDRDELQGAWRSWRSGARKLQEQEEWIQREQEREDFLRHEVELLQDLGPRVGETEELEGERNSLLHVEERRQSLQEALAGFRGEETLSESLRALQKISEVDQKAGDLAADLETHLDGIRDIEGEIRELQSFVEGEPGRLEAIESRLLELRSASRRFRGASEEELCKLLQKKEAELALLEDAESTEQLRQETEKLQKAFLDTAKRASQQRKKAALDLAAKVNKELEELDVRAEFFVRLEDGEPASTGTDKAEFLLRRGNKLASLASAASGGEISRVSLALLLAGGSEPRTYIFDEIDTGIGGETAHLVARKLQDLARQSQVIVVSHLPQIALRAEHLLALRREKDRTKITSADTKDERHRELARLAGARGEEWGASLEEMLLEASGD